MTPKINATTPRKIPNPAAGVNEKMTPTAPSMTAVSANPRPFFGALGSGWAGVFGSTATVGAEGGGGAMFAGCPGGSGGTPAATGGGAGNLLAGLGLDSSWGSDGSLMTA
ncbi:hypothetical protein GCM10009776_32630 [Microbacterium deminutum]|uniref:Uncharacterized protein n=1 Tax=Microbacterium deminutum TaxID=344164 RepID=A0ABN2RCL4_9MICO